jgi:hypothetical protein
LETHLAREPAWCHRPDLDPRKAALVPATLPTAVAAILARDPALISVLEVL